MHQAVEKILVTHEQISKRCVELGALINKDYKGETIILVGLLKGSVPFIAELMKHMDIECEIDFMDVSSYHGTTTSGDIRIIKDLECSVKDRHVLICEDIIDSGKTLQAVTQMLISKSAKSVKVVSLLDKPEGRVVDIQADYVGFVIPNEFVIGFGLDYDELYRNLPYVGVLKPSYYQ